MLKHMIQGKLWAKLTKHHVLHLFGGILILTGHVKMRMAYVIFFNALQNSLDKPLLSFVVVDFASTTTH